MEGIGKYGGGNRDSHLKEYRKYRIIFYGNYGKYVIIIHAKYGT